MTFLGLFTKLGKQPVHNTRVSRVVAIFSHEELSEMLTQKQYSYEIPLDLKFGNGNQKMWFVKSKK